MSWTAGLPELSGLEPATRTRLDRLVPKDVPTGAVLFRPGEAVAGYVVVLSGRVEVRLVAPSGREMALYVVVPGQSCIQSTLGLLGGDDSYSGEAVATMPTRMVLLPGPLFTDLLAGSPGFRALVLTAFAARMQAVMHRLEALSFLPVETRLARELLDRADAHGVIHTTQEALAVATGSAREVVSRRLSAFARAGLVALGRGTVTVTDRPALFEMAGLSPL